MKKLVLFVFLLCATFALATAPTLTVVTATLQDSSTQVWANATWTTTFARPAGSNATFNNNGHTITPSQTGTANSSGVFTVTLDDNLAVAPAGSSWKFTICPNASVVSCNDLQLTITGASMNISGQLNAILTVPVVSSAPVIARAYNDTEVVGSYGTLYINSITNVLKECTSLFCQGTGWTTITVPTNNPIFTGTLTVPCVKFDFSASDDTTVCSQTGTGHIAVTLPASAGTLALLASPTFTGVPAAPTASPGTNTTQLATTAFVLANGGTGNVSNSGTPLAHQAAVWTDATHILGVTPSTSGLCFLSNGTSVDPSFQTCPGGNVNNSGTPLNHQVAIWTDATHVQGLTPSTNGFVLTSNGTSADPSFQAPSGGGAAFPAPVGTMHFLQFNNSTTLTASSGNNWPGGMWSELGGSFTVQSNVPNTNSPPDYKLITTGGGAGASSSIAEDAVTQQGSFNIFGAYACYCSVELGGQHIVWMAMSNLLYGSLGVVNPAGTVFGFRYAGTVDTNWQAYVGTAAGTFTSTDTGVAVDTDFHQFAFARNATGGIDYFIDGTKVATNASGVTGFPGGTTVVYAALENGLIGASVNLSLFFNSVRWWSIY